MNIKRLLNLINKLKLYFDKQTQETNQKAMVCVPSYLKVNFIIYNLILLNCFIYINFIQMQDKKILNQFAAKISKAKILHDNTQAICQKLRREVAQLEKEYSTIHSQREAAENMEKSLKYQLQMTQKAENEASAKCRREESQLQELRENRKKLKREKEIEQHTLLKNKLELEELITKRQQLEATAKSLSQKLQGVTSQKQVLQQQYNKTESAIRKYNQNIANLQQQIQKMRDVITKNTVPVHNVNESQVSQNH